MWSGQPVPVPCLAARAGNLKVLVLLQDQGLPQQPGDEHDVHQAERVAEEVGAFLIHSFNKLLNGLQQLLLCFLLLVLLLYAMATLRQLWCITAPHRTSLCCCQFNVSGT